MSFKFIDYSATYFTTIAKKPIPSKRGGKLVQIANHSTNDEYLVLSPKELSVYPDIVLNKDLEYRIVGVVMEKKKRYK